MLISLSQAMSTQVVKPLSLMHGQSNVRAMVTFAATEHHLPLDSSILYCLATEGQVWAAFSRSLC